MSRFQNLIGEALKHWLPNEVRNENFKPEWLFGMELDFYFPNINLAIEVQGQQHYKFTPKFHASIKDFKNQKWRDIRKRKICHSRGIVILVARTGKGLQFCGLEKKIRNALGIKMARIPDSLKNQWKDHARALHKIAVGVDRLGSEYN
jgi:hypothetical protein